MRTEKNWETKAKRFVVFLDIMGFKDFIYRNPHEVVYEKLLFLSKRKEALEKASESIGKDCLNSAIYSTSFSDSIIMFSKDDSSACFESISAAAAFLVKEALTHYIPIKGGIAYGQITVNKSQQIFFGQPIIDAYEMQEDVYYYGIAAHHTINNYLTLHHSDISLWTYNVLYKEILTPLKSGKINHHNINWFEFTTGLSGRNKEKGHLLPQFNATMCELKSRTSGAPRKYIDNTEAVFHLMYPGERG